MEKSKRHRARAEPPAAPRTFAEQSDDLLDLADLFGRRKDERGETLPRFLAQQAQTAARLYRALHRFIRGEMREHRVEINVDLQVMSQPIPIQNPFDSLAFDAALRFAQPNPARAHNPFPSPSLARPAKRLPGAQG